MRSKHKLTTLPGPINGAHSFSDKVHNDKLVFTERARGDVHSNSKACLTIFGQELAQFEGELAPTGLLASMLFASLHLPVFKGYTNKQSN